MVLKGLKVLLVEDEGTVSMLIEEFLENLGCELAGSATRLDEAMEMARTVDADVAVVDVNLAGELSYPAAQILRERGIPIILATGYGATGFPEEFGGVAVLPKPFKQSSLAEQLTAAIQGSRDDG